MKKITHICQKFLESGQFPEKKILDKYLPKAMKKAEGDGNPLEFAANLFSFQLALTMHSVYTAATAIEQIDVCLRMDKFFKAHLRHIVDASVEKARNIEAYSVCQQVKEQTMNVIPLTPDGEPVWAGDISYNRQFMATLIGWQSVFSQISVNNNEFMQRMAPQ